VATQCVLSAALDDSQAASDEIKAASDDSRAALNEIQPGPA
jgi:hypothetical protein